MIEVYGDFWEFPADTKCLTTNGFVRRDGQAVMGRGIALQAAERYVWFPGALGASLETHGNHLTIIDTVDGVDYLAFPVKHHWRQVADLELIRQSAQELADRYQGWPGPILLPRPGCGNGQLRWNQVRPILAPILIGDNYYVIDRKARP